MNVCKFCGDMLSGSSDLERGYHMQCKLKMDREEVAAAKKNIDMRKLPRAKIVSGGSTGLVQQKGRIRDSNRYKKSGIRKEIKDTLKMYGFDIVLMQIGSTYDAIEEDADFFHKEFGYKYNPIITSYNATGFPLHMLNKVKDKLINCNKEFCILDEVDEDPSRIIRKVVFTTFDSNAKDLTFIGGPK